MVFFFSPRKVTRDHVMMSSVVKTGDYYIIQPQISNREESRGEERRKRSKRWKGKSEGKEDDLGPRNDLLCIPIMRLHEYQSGALDGQPGQSARDRWSQISEVMMRQERRKITADASFFQRSREDRWATLWLLHHIHVNANNDASEIGHIQTKLLNLLLVSLWCLFSIVLPWLTRSKDDGSKNALVAAWFNHFFFSSRYHELEKSDRGGFSIFGQALCFERWHICTLTVGAC